MSKRHVHLLSVLSVVIILTLSTIIVSGQLPPSIIVSPVWRPAAQLTTLDTVGTAYPIHDAGDEYNYVDVELRVTTTVQFWATQFKCTVPSTIMDSYTQNGSPADPSDDIAMITPGPTWGNFTQINSDFNPANGQMGATFARINGTGVNPLGTNGVTSQLLLATLRYRVKPQAAGFVGTAAITCTFSFLNQDGRPVVVPVVQAPPPLSVRYGYSISGVVTYQAQTNHAGIGIYCNWLGDGAFTVNDPLGVTAVNGVFNLNNVRKLGSYRCEYYGNRLPGSPTPTTNDGDNFVSTFQNFYLSENSIRLLPVALRAGNVEIDGSATYIGTPDLDTLTINFNNLTNTPPGALWTTPYINGDTNGDRLTNTADLAIVGRNYNWGTWFPTEHLILSSAAVTSLNNRLWLTIDPFYIDSMPFIRTQQFVAGSNRDFWPTLSPDGSRLAFVRQIGTGNAARYVLYVAPITNGVVGAPLRLTPATNWVYDDFAPSWSLDGQRLAFVCSRFNSAGNQDWLFDKGNLCVVDANGRNLSVESAVTMHIFPPAWFVNDTLLFGGVTGLTGCGYTICKYDTDTNTVTVFDADIPATGADMPTVTRNGLFDVFYRYNDGVNRRLRYATLNGTNTIDAFEVSTSAVAPFHVEVGDAWPIPITNTLDWYNVFDTRRDIIFTEYSSNYSVSGCSVKTVTQSGAQFWSSLSSRVLQTWGACNTSWDGSFATATNLHALRNTADWTP